MAKHDPLRNEIIWALNGGKAHAGFDTAIAKIPKKYYGVEIAELPYTLWGVLQHMQLAQRDILEYIINPDYQERVWPDEYWPQKKAPSSSKEWDKCVNEFRKDLAELTAIVQNPKSKLTEPIPHLKNGPTLLREMLLVIDHNAYHIGQIILLRRLLGIWKD